MTSNGGPGRRWPGTRPHGSGPPSPAPAALRTVQPPCSSPAEAVSRAATQGRRGASTRLSPPLGRTRSSPADSTSRTTRAAQRAPAADPGQQARGSRTTAVRRRAWAPRRAWWWRPSRRGPRPRPPPRRRVQRAAAPRPERSCRSRAGRGARMPPGPGPWRRGQGGGAHPQLCLADPIHRLHPGPQVQSQQRQRDGHRRTPHPRPRQGGQACTQHGDGTHSDGQQVPRPEPGLPHPGHRQDQQPDPHRGKQTPRLASTRHEAGHPRRQEHLHQHPRGPAPGLQGDKGRPAPGEPPLLNPARRSGSREDRQGSVAAPHQGREDRSAAEGSPERPAARPGRRQGHPKGHKPPSGRSHRLEGHRRRNQPHARTHRESGQPVGPRPGHPHTQGGQPQGWPVGPHLQGRLDRQGPQRSQGRRHRAALPRPEPPARKAGAQHHPEAAEQGKQPAGLHHPAAPRRQGLHEQHVGLGLGAILQGAAQEQRAARPRGVREVQEAPEGEAHPQGQHQHGQKTRGGGPAPGQSSGRAVRRHSRGFFRRAFLSPCRFLPSRRRRTLPRVGRVGRRRFRGRWCSSMRSAMRA